MYALTNATAGCRVGLRAGLACAVSARREIVTDDREIHCRNDRKLLRLLKNARLKYSQAAIEDIDSRQRCGIDRREVMSLALGDWVSAGHTILITGPTGAGKSWPACAPAQHACRRGRSAIYQRLSHLQEELRMRPGSGAFGKWLIQLARTDVLIIDDWGMGSIDSMSRSGLFNEYIHRAPDSKLNKADRAALEHAKANYANNKGDAVTHGELIKACEAVYGYAGRNQCGS